jgi:hypothetical protein
VPKGGGAAASGGAPSGASSSFDAEVAEVQAELSRLALNNFGAGGAGAGAAGGAGGAAKRPPALSRMKKAELQVPASPCAGPPHALAVTPARPPPCSCS